MTHGVGFYTFGNQLELMLTRSSYCSGHDPSIFVLFYSSSLLLSSVTRRRIYPQLSSGQAVVPGVIPSSPRYVPSFFLSRIGYTRDWNGPLRLNAG